MFRSLCILALMAAAVLPARAEFGEVDAVPAATLLLPYFEADLAEGSSSTTIFSVNNADTAPVIAHVTYWTNLGVATFSYDITLEGLDVQTVSVRDLFLSGFFATGDSSTDTLTEAQRLALLADHTGQPNPNTNLCSSFNLGDEVARGYITIDAMNEAGAGFPFEDGYFVDGGNGKASNRNVLWGDFFYADPTNNFAQGERMVHIEAGTFDFKGAPTFNTFYRNFVDSDGSDNREPLPTLWGAGYDERDGLFAGTHLSYWRETAGIVEPFLCGALPDFPLPTNDIVAFDEEENPFDVTELTLFPLASGTTEVAELDLPFEKGWLFLDLNVALPSKGTATSVERQSYVVVRDFSQGRFGRAIAATPLTSIFGK